MTDKTYKYSEIFHSFQGEGTMTGHNTAWIRFFLCNLRCEGFSQPDPTDPSTYVLPYKDFDVSTIDKIEDLPVWTQGCDSSYSYAKKYRHLAHDETASAICDQIQDSLKHESNPNGLFFHPVTGQHTHMAFTGGEPMLKANQKAIIAIMNEFAERDNIPNFVTVETNGTQKLTDDFKDMLIDYENMTGVFEDKSTEFADWFWSVSPKLWSTAGEKPKKAIVPEVVGSYAEFGWGQLKYVVNGTDAAWKEVEEHTESFREVACEWDVWIMGVGATKEQQEDQIIADISMDAMKRGYHVSGRLHAYVFGNKIGT